MATARAQAPKVQGSPYEHLREVYGMARQRTAADQERADRLRARLPVRVWGYLVGASGFVEVAPSGAVSPVSREEWPIDQDPLYGEDQPLAGGEF